MGGKNGFSCRKSIHVLIQISYFLLIFVGKTEARCVGNIAHCGSGFCHSVYHTSQILIIGAPGILRIELHILYEFLGVGHSRYRTLYYLVPCAVELILNVRVAGTDSRMDALALGILQCLRRTIYIFLHGAGQSAYRRPGYSFGYFHHAVEISRTGNRESCLYDIHPKRLQLLCHLNFLHGIQLATWNLFSIPKRRIKDKKSVIHVCYLMLYICLIRQKPSATNASAGKALAFLVRYLLKGVPPMPITS